MAKPAEIKTKATDNSVSDFIQSLPEEHKRKDGETLLRLMQKASGEAPKLWGSSIVGFGLKRYKSPASGREVDWFKIGFSPRKANFSLPLVLDLQQYATTLAKLGKHKTGVGCLYINKLDDVDLKVLEELIVAAVKNK